MALIAIAAAAAFLFDGRHLAPGVLEPVGPGTIPNATCWLVIALSLAMLARTLLASGEGQAAPVAGERWGDVAFVFVLTCAYVATLGFGLVRYGIATALFLAIAILWLADDRRKAAPFALAVAVALGTGLDYLFRHVLVTDLP